MIQEKRKLTHIDRELHPFRVDQTETNPNEQTKIPSHKHLTKSFFTLQSSPIESVRRRLGLYNTPTAPL